MVERWYLVLPMFSAFFYAISALSQKRAIDAGVGPWRMSTLTIWSMGLVFMPFIFFEDSWAPPDPFWKVLLCGILFPVGQVLTVISITKGDVSVATPVLGSKVVLVVLILSIFTDEVVSSYIWIAAVLTTLGVLLLQWDPRAEKRKTLGFTVLLSLGSAVCFACADVLVQQGSLDSGFYRFIA
ncbi:MAG: EamA family transporter, partial [Verrucomicrobiota bacterium]